MPDEAFIQALADLHEEEVIDLAALRTSCLAKITAGGGEIRFITAGSQNGKMAQQEARMDAAELLGAVNQALRIANGSNVTLTYMDFSGMQ